MMHTLLIRFLRCIVPWTFFSSAMAVFAIAGTIPQPHFRTITASGKELKSPFDGIVPNDFVRDVLVRRINRPGKTILDGSRNDIRDMFRRMITAEAPPFLSCPTGGICAQPGTFAVPGIFCQDNNGCAVDVHNQASGGDLSSGTNELYDCQQCCVDWSTCPLDSGGGGGPNPPPCDIDPSTGTCGSGGSPIILDVEGEGFHLTSASAGVTFDIAGTGHPVLIGWTDPHFDNAFLALPGPDGLVHNGKELFGNFTPQPQSAHPNGFIALAQFDTPENGGNGDGMIDERDAVFSRLRLWIDKNHDGICQPEELHRLVDLGVYSLALNYVESRRTDQFGNQFRYKGQVNPGDRKDRRDQASPSDPGRWTYDVFFSVQ